MSRRRHRGGQSNVSKAMPNDADIMTGTIADAAATKMSDVEQYWYLYKKHPWIRACVRLIGNAMGQEGYDVVPIDDAKPLAENDNNVARIHYFLRTGFVGKCNTFRKFRKTIGIDLCVFAVGYARKKYGVVEGEQTLVALERLNPLVLKPKLNADKTAIESYVLKKTPTESPSGVVAQIAQQMTPIDLRTQETIPAEELIVFTLDDGGDDVLPPPSPLESLDLTIAVDFSVRQHRRGFFTNGTQLGNVLVCKSGNDDGVRDAQKKLRLQAGGHNAFRNIAVAGDWDVKSLLQQGGRDFDFIKGSELTLEEVCAVYSVPPSKLRDVSGAMGQSGKGEDDEAFEQECILPLEENFYETLTIELLEKEFDISHFSFAPARRNKVRLDRFDAAVKLVKFGGTGNEARDLVGLPKSDEEGMDTPLFIGATGQGGVIDDEIDPVTPPAPQPGQQPGDVPDETEIDNENTDGSGKPAAKGKARARPWY